MAFDVNPQCHAIGNISICVMLMSDRKHKDTPAVQSARDNNTQISRREKPRRLMAPQTFQLSLA
jgi:hypothetical protein